MGYPKQSTASLVYSQGIKTWAILNKVPLVLFIRKGSKHGLS